MMDMMNGCVWANNCDSLEASEALERAGEDRASDIDGCVFSFYLKCPTQAQAQEYLGSCSEEIGTFLMDFVPDERHVRVGSKGLPHAANPRHSNYLKAELDKVQVLVVDDTLINLKVISRMLQAMGFRDVRSATSGVRALEMLEEKPACDLILTDYQMPGMDGLEFSAKTRELYSNLASNNERNCEKYRCPEYSSRPTCSPSAPLPC